MTDPAGVFDSDHHRKILGHLSLPTDGYVWPVETLARRVGHGLTVEHVQDILRELAVSGHAEDLGGHGWRMTQKGFDHLTGPIRKEPAPGAPVIGPAVIHIGDQPVEPVPVPEKKRLFRRRKG